MNFAIQGSRPIWQQLTEQLARRIITGAYPLGSRFPAVRELAAEAGATEALKARDPLTWVGLMNTCKAQAEEVILAELIYA